jgi:hypothetical protein
VATATQHASAIEGRTRGRTALTAMAATPTSLATWTDSRLVGNWPLPGTRTTQNTFLLVALFMNARFAIQFGLTHLLEICRVCYRVLAASQPMRLSRPGSPQTDDFGSLLSRC